MSPELGPDLSRIGEHKFDKCYTPQLQPLLADEPSW